MKTNTKNGNRFAQFIIDNNLYNEHYSCEDYEKYLSYSNYKQNFWEDFIYAMMEDFNKPIKL